jgi:hypothetical protein
MAGVTSKLTRLLVGAAMGAGAAGVILALADVHSPVRTALVILFVVVAPTAAIAGLLRSFDVFARLILAVVAALAVVSILGVILLSAGLWSPIGELVGVAVFTALCLAAQVPSVRARVAAWAGPRWHALGQHIPGLRTVLAGPEPRPAETTETTPAVRYAAEVQLTGAEPAEVDPAGAEATENQPAGPAGNGSTGAAEPTGATEPTAPLPAIRD